MFSTMLFGRFRGMTRENEKFGRYKIGFFDVMVQILVIILLELSLSGSCALTTSIPFANFTVREIQGGMFIIQIGQKIFKIGQERDLNATAALKYTYSVQLDRVHNLGPYWLTIGYKSANFYFPSQPASGETFGIFYSNKQSSTFDIDLLLSVQTDWNFVRVSYIVFSMAIPNVYDFYSYCTINTVIPTGQFQDFSYTNPAISAISSPFYKIIGIFKFGGIYEVSGASIQSMKVEIFQNTTNNFTIRIWSDGYYIQQLGVQGLFIDSNLVDNNKLETVILTTDYQYTAPNQYIQTIALQNTVVIFPPKNVFFSLYQFISTNDLFYQFWVNPAGTINLAKYASLNSISQSMLIFYQNSCSNTTFYDPILSICSRCPENCLSCNRTNCFQCAQNYQIQSDNITCLCNFNSITGICFDFDSSLMKGCILATQNSSKITCQTCLSSLKLILKNEQCICKQGFMFDSNKICTEVCGDGFRQSMECDDGNLIDGDGCSSKCFLEKGFQCDISSVRSWCRSQVYLKLQLVNIQKTDGNSAIMSFGLNSNSIPFQLQKKYFQTSQKGQKMLKMKLRLKDGTQYELQIELLSLQSNQFRFLVPYLFTIQGLDASLTLNMSNSPYLMKEMNIQFKTIGTNEPLKYTQNSQLFQGVNKGSIAIAIISLFLLLIGLLAPKYIGLQAILTLQLIFYSILLIRDKDNFNPGLKSMSFLKFSTGFNQILDWTQIVIGNDVAAKYKFLGIKKLALQNFNISFVVLLTSSIIFYLSSIIRSKAETVLIERRKKKEQRNNDQIQDLSEQFMKWLKRNELCYRVQSQISMWSVLQIISCFGSQLMIGNQLVIIKEGGHMISLSAVVMLVGWMIVSISGIEQWRILLLSETTLEKLRERPSEMAYKKISFLYLLIVAIPIFFLNELLINNVSFAALFVLIFHIGYICIIYSINPYQKSLRIHTYGLALNLFIYFYFLIIVNMSNFMDFSQITWLIFTYSILALSMILVVFTIARLYYEYRYGQELEKKIQREREKEQERKKEEEERKLNKKVKILRNKANQKLNPHQLYQLQNTYLHQNTVRQAEMKNYLKFLEQRPTITQEQKHTYYFDKYNQHPLEWLKQNDPKQYEQRLIKSQQHRAKEKQKINQTLSNPYYKQTVKKLKDQFLGHYRTNKTKNNSSKV